jgi:hypothetical protein
MCEASYTPGHDYDNYGHAIHWVCHSPAYLWEVGFPAMLEDIVVMNLTSAEGYLHSHHSTSLDCILTRSAVSPPYSLINNLCSGTRIATTLV